MTKNKFEYKHKHNNNREEFVHCVKCHKGKCKMVKFNMGTLMHSDNTKAIFRCDKCGQIMIRTERWPEKGEQHAGKNRREEDSRGHSKPVQHEASKENKGESKSAATTELGKVRRDGQQEAKPGTEGCRATTTENQRKE